MYATNATLQTRICIVHGTQVSAGSVASVVVKNWVGALALLSFHDFFPCLTIIFEETPPLTRQPHPALPNCNAVVHVNPGGIIDG
tara:strand:+ start:279 stop:533 length:255 start_codon:yes stop_codon:yes gene_type:complete